MLAGTVEQPFRIRHAQVDAAVRLHMGIAGVKGTTGTARKKQGERHGRGLPVPIFIPRTVVHALAPDQIELAIVYERRQVPLASGRKVGDGADDLAALDYVDLMLGQGDDD